MRTRIGVVALLCAVFGLSALAAIRTVTFRAETMGTEQASQRLSQAVKAVPGVLDMAADPSSRMVMVRYDAARTTVIDITDAAAEAGYTLNVVTPTGGSTSAAQASNRSLEAMKEFALVLNQTREARKDGRYGLVRNLMPAMKLRRDALVAAEKSSSALARQRAGAASTYQLALDLSRQVDALASVAEAKERNKVDAALPEVRMAFQKLAKAANYDEMVAPLDESAKGKPVSLQDQLMEKIKALTK